MITCNCGRVTVGFTPLVDRWRADGPGDENNRMAESARDFAMQLCPICNGGKPVNLGLYHADGGERVRTVNTEQVVVTVKD